MNKHTFKHIYKDAEGALCAVLGTSFERLASWLHFQFQLPADNTVAILLTRLLEYKVQTPYTDVGANTQVAESSPNLPELTHCNIVSLPRRRNLMLPTRESSQFLNVVIYFAPMKETSVLQSALCYVTSPFYR